MNIFNAFSKHAPNSVYWSILAGMLAGISYSLVIPIILVVYTPEPLGVEPLVSVPKTFLGFEVAHYKMAQLFVAVCLFILVMKTFSQVALLRTSLDVTRTLRLEIYQRILRTPIDKLEKFGSARLIAMITTDISNIVFGARAMPDILINIVTALGMLGFLLFLNVDVFWFVIGAILIGIVTYQLPMFIGNQYYSKARNGLDGLHEGIRGLILGAKELKLDLDKQEDFLENTLVAREDLVIKSEKKAHSIITASANYGDLLSLLVIGCVAFVFVNYHSVSDKDLIGVTMALLYISGPIGVIVNSIPQIISAKVSMNKINDSLRQLPEEPVGNLNTIPEWQNIEFRDVCYQYDSEASSGFSVGPLNLTIKRGQVTFIVGGNGSGKSTMSKLMTLHYRPSSGKILFGGESVESDNLDAARKHVSSIYSDYYLFDRILGHGSLSEDEINVMLKELGLGHKVQYENNNFSSLSLSDGQRRRLALVVAYLDDKSLYLFDEWAADQDPIFKRYFYYQILPALKAKNKAVVVISHDDRYFNLADQIFEMDSGSISVGDIVGTTVTNDASVIQQFNSATRITASNEEA